jgi:hypothetical protein
MVAGRKLRGLLATGIGGGTVRRWGASPCTIGESPRSFDGVGMNLYLSQTNHLTQSNYTAVVMKTGCFSSLDRIENIRFSFRA